MGTVFGKNTTSASITVAGHKVYYIDSTDAEIVEVEKTAPLEILLGFTWNNDSSELEAVDISNDDYWSRVISQHDKELLQSLGLFVDVDFLKYGSLKKDSSYTYTVIGVYTGIGEGEISADLLSYFTVGISSSHPTYQNVARIICDTSVPVLVKTWKCRVSIGMTFKYNAFKYTLSGTPYWYVIDGEHDTWTDDLSAWGYSEVQPAPVLPEVSIDSNPVGSGTQTLVVNDFTGPLHYTGSGGWSGDAIPYDTNKKYSLTTYNNGTLGGLQSCGIFVPISVSTQSGGPYYVGVKNISSTSQSFMSVYVATCSSNLATVVTVYDSSNVAYNAFKFTANNVDYYYVLDGTQTDWTDDLAGIGYSLYEEIILYIPGGSQNTYYCQGNIISSYSGEPDNSYLHTAYSDSGLTTPAAYDSTKRYERGYYSDGVWTRSAVQSVSDMPASTDSSNPVSTQILYSRGTLKFWMISNYPTSGGVSFRFTNDPTGFRCRLYPAEYIEVFFYLGDTLNYVTFNQNDYWGTFVGSTTTANALEAFGVPLERYGTSTHRVVARDCGGFIFTPLGLYNDGGELAADMSNFYCEVGPNNPENAYYGMCIKSINAYSTQARTWKCRITKNS